MTQTIPEGWIQSTVGECFNEIRNGSTAPQNKDKKGFPVTRIETIQNGKFDLNRLRHSHAVTPKSLETYKYKLGDIAFSHINSYEHVGKTAIYEGIPETLIHGMNLLRMTPDSEQLLPRFAYYFMQTEWFREEVRMRVGHAVNQVSINQKKLSEVPFILAPLREQIQISTKLDHVLPRIDEAKSRLNKIPTILKRFRQAVLAAACSGRLTADWRARNIRQPPKSTFGEAIDDNDELPDIPSNWKWVRFGSIISELRNGVSTRPSMTPPGIPILRISSTRPGRVELSDVRYLQSGDEHFPQCTLRDGDLLFTRYNGSIELLGVCGMVRDLGSRILLYPDKLMRVRFSNEAILPAYVETFFSAPEVHERVVAKSKSSAGQNGISGSDIKNQPLALPPVEEQKEIVRRVESLFALADQLEARLEKAQSFVNKITPSVLAKAFRGELFNQSAS